MAEEKGLIGGGGFTSPSETVPDVTPELKAIALDLRKRFGKTALETLDDYIELVTRAPKYPIL